MSSVESADGWKTWAGGFNPAPGLSVDVLFRDGDGSQRARPSEHLDWTHAGRGSDIVKFRLTDPWETQLDAPASSDNAEPKSIGRDPGFPPIDASMISAPDGGSIKFLESFIPPGAKISGAMIADAPIFTGTEKERKDQAGCFRTVQIPPGYDKLFAVLMQAFNQASEGKGKERHARTGVAFQDQPMALINKQIGSIDGFIYQAHKKSLEAIRLPDGRAQAEILGAINYLAGAVIALDTWANKSSSKH